MALQLTSEIGNYMISGGMETVLVSWQLDTGKRDFLPHLGAPIENIIVSPSGSSYAIHLDDNTTMILSTADLKPSAYFSGLQSSTFIDNRRRDTHVARISIPAESIAGHVVSTISSAKPSQILLAVANDAVSAASPSLTSAALLQTFDMTSFQSIAKQPLARTNTTNTKQNSLAMQTADPTITHLCTSADGTWLASVDQWQSSPSTTARHDAEISEYDDRLAPHREVHLNFWTARKDDATQYEPITRIHEAHCTSQPEAIFDLISDRRSDCFVTLGDDAMVKIWKPQPSSKSRLQHQVDGGVSWKWACTMAIPLGESGKTGDDVARVDVTPQSRKRHGALAFSEDGSTLFSAFGADDDAVLYIIDSETGEIRNTIYDLFRGGIRSIASLSSAVILLSDDLKLYDVVADELLYGVRLHRQGRGATSGHLAVNYESGTFAVAISTSELPVSRFRKGAASEVAIFSPAQMQPLYQEVFPDLILSLLSTPASSGFIAIDACAKVWSLVEAASETQLAQPLADLNLHEEASQLLSQQDDAVEMVTLQEDLSEDENGDGSEGDEVGEIGRETAVFAPERLAEIFDAAPAFALPPIEQLFYQVADLLSPTPLSNQRA
jgi:NET1-associated nuclear protein 1 (U3 small nucleolar RNA-associated protein 17)